MYDYYNAVKKDVREYIRIDVDFSEYDNMEELEESLNEELYTAGSVTGNGKGSYTCDPYVAEENICHNLDLLKLAVEKSSMSFNLLQDGAEAADVIIRCYVLGSCIAEVLPEFEEAFNEAHNRKG